MIEADAILDNADWLKQTWLLPPYKSKEFNQHLASIGMTLAQFKKLPLYASAVGQGIIVKDKWAGGKK